MNKNDRCVRTGVVLACVLAALVGGSSRALADYYTQKPIFQPHPSEKDKKPWSVRNFGPVGIGIDITQPGFVMVVSNVEKGSPAEKTGKLKKGQVIESINGQVLQDRDPREILGDLITQAEATGGRIDLKIKDVGSVVVEIPVMGTYSPTWPLNCPKSDKIVRQLADVLAKDEKPRWGSVLFLLSTGEEKDLEVVKKWMKGIETIGAQNWDKGYKGMGLCEYYLRTGDQSVLPVIKKMTVELNANIFNGGWSGRGAAAAFTYSTGTGQMHAAGVHCVTFLLMAQMCGVDVDKTMLNDALTAFYRFSGHGNVAYGDGLPEGGFRDNGKTGGLAVAMAAAALLAPEGEQSIYAQARDLNAMKSFYATNWFHVAHTGGGIGEIWHHIAMNLVRESRPVPYRSYFDTRRCMMELSRRFDGSIGIAGFNDRYDRSATEDDHAWGTYFALTYTLPRQKLQLFGAPRSPFAKTYKLPARPWGNQTDDAFQSPDPVPGSSLTKADLMTETVENDASLAVFNRINQPDVSDEVLTRYFHHPEFGLREGAMSVAVRTERYHLVLPLLKSDDPRLRHVGVLAIAGMFKGDPIPAEKVTPEMWAEISRIVDDPNEAWWITQDAMRALRRADPKTIARHTDRLIALVDHKSWWMNMAAADALVPLATDPAHYKTLLPKLVQHIANSRSSQQLKPVWSLTSLLKSAKPEVKTYAMKLLADAYENLPPTLQTPQGMSLDGTISTIRRKLGDLMVLLPGGTEFALKIPKTTAAYIQSGEEKDLYVYSGFKPNDKLSGKWLYLGNMSASDDMGKVVQNSLKAIEKRKQTQTGRNRYKPTYLALGAGGKVDPNTHWSGDMLIDIPTGEARKMSTREFDGKDYLLVEIGGFPEPLTEGWSPRYMLYVREK